MAGIRYRQVEDGEWSNFPRTEKVACCDCGLIHTYRWRVRKGYFERQAIRDNRATYARRKRLGIKIKRP